jgi:hypothetical protein
VPAFLAGCSVPRKGCELSPVEIGALVALDHAAITAFAEALDRRLQKVDFRSHPNRGGD